MRDIETLDQIGLTGTYAPIRTSKLQKKPEFRGSILSGLMDFAYSVPDFRRSNKGNLRHRLGDVIMLMALGRASGCVGRSEIIEFGRHNLNKFRKMGMLRNGVPSEATLCRIANGVDDLAMADRMREFAKPFHRELLKGLSGMEIICMDGKAERGTVQTNGRNPDIVSAYSPDTGIILATEACQEKSNEIKAVPRLIDNIEAAGKVFTADAMSMQKDIIDKIRQKGGDFLIELKANQRSLRYGIEDRLKAHAPLHSYTEGPGAWTSTSSRIKRRSSKSARNLDTIQRIVYSVFSIWKGRRKKRADRKKGMAELMRHVSVSFTRLIRFLLQK